MRIRRGKPYSSLARGTRFPAKIPVADRTNRRADGAEDRLPEAGFPRTAGIASAAGFLLLLLIAGFCLLDLTTAGPFGMTTPTVPSGVVAEQRRDAQSLAASIATSATSAAHDLQVVASARAFDDPGNDQLLSSLSVVYPTWRGVALIDADSRALLAAHGETVPLDVLDGVDLDRLTVRAATQPGGVPLMLSAVPLTGDRADQVLVVSTALPLTSTPPTGPVRQQLRLVSANGTVLESVGVPDDPSVRGLLTAAANAAANGPGVLTGPNSAGPQPIAPVVAYAPVNTPLVTGDLGLAVVTTTWLPADTTPPQWPGLIPAGALLIVAALALLLLRCGLIAPIRRLRMDALAVAAGDRGEPVRPSRIAEVRRTATALERCRRLLCGETNPDRPSTRRGVPARLLVGLVTVAILGWAAAVFCTVGLQRSAVPAAVVAEQGLRLDRSTDALRAGLIDSLAELRAAAQLNATKPAARLPPLVAQLATDPAFRSVYVTDSTGTVQQRGGRAPLRTGPLPSGAGQTGLHQQNTSGRVPVVYAYAQLSGGRMLIGEFDITRLTEPLELAGEQVRVVDEGDRTILDTQGYLAFDPLSDATLRTATATARTGQIPNQTDGNTLVVASALAHDGAASALDWVVLAEQPVSALGIAANVVHGGAQAAALIAAALAILLCGWHESVLVRPLRRVASATERVATGQSTEVVYPQRQDEIGTVAACVEICRQALADGVGELGTVPTSLSLSGNRF